MIKIIVVAVIVVIAAILVPAATRPDSFRVERSAQSNAPPEKILSLVNDFHQWGTWSPYEKLDPTMKRTYAQPQRVATHLTWSMDGPAPFMHKVVGLFLNMDRMIGSDFATGLANLKALAP